MESVPIQLFAFLNVKMYDLGESLFYQEVATVFGATKSSPIYDCSIVYHV